jgi:hypothetical protein
MIQGAEIIGIPGLVDEKLDLTLHALPLSGIAFLVALQLLVDLLNGAGGGLILVLFVVLVSGAGSVFTDGIGQSTIGILFLFAGVFVVLVIGAPGSGSLGLSRLEGTHGPLVQWIGYYGREDGEQCLGIVAKDRGGGFCG